MDSLHRSVRPVLLDLSRELEALESASANPNLPPAASASIQTSYRQNLAALRAALASMRAALPSEPPPRRATWAARLRALEDQAAELSSADARVSARFREIDVDAGVREELFRRRAGLGAARGGSGDAVIGFGPDATAGAVTEGKALGASQSGVSGILATGAGALEALVGQRNRLKGARKKVMDVMNTMNAGKALIGQIERRDASDRLLLYGLMAAILALLGVAVFIKHARAA
jgi:golgi SNAP receptor complex member 2